MPLFTAAKKSYNFRSRAPEKIIQVFPYSDTNNQSNEENAACANLLSEYRNQMDKKDGNIGNAMVAQGKLNQYNAMCNTGASVSAASHQPSFGDHMQEIEKKRQLDDIEATTRRILSNQR